MLKNKSKPFVIMLVGLLWASLVLAQESANSAGGNASGGGGSVAFSVGQVVYTTNTGNSGSIAQGVQHAYEFFTFGFSETELSISLKVFPNPVAEYLILEISDYTNEELLYQLFDMQGNELSKEQIVKQQTLINMNGLPTATYFMNVVNQENKKVQCFKIIKIQ